MDLWNLFFKLKIFWVIAKCYKCVVLQAAGIEHWLNLGANASKINLGIATYGRCFTLTDPNNIELYAPATAGHPGPYTNQSGFLGYNEVHYCIRILCLKIYGNIQCPKLVLTVLYYKSYEIV